MSDLVVYAKRQWQISCWHQACKHWLAYSSVGSITCFQASTAKDDFVHWLRIFLSKRSHGTDSLHSGHMGSESLQTHLHICTRVKTNATMTNLLLPPPQPFLKQTLEKQKQNQPTNQHPPPPRYPFCRFFPLKRTDLHRRTLAAEVSNLSSTF